jgi:DNA-binding transcriptional LysR family regulator
VCGYRALLAALAASRRRSIHVVPEVQGASLQRELVLAGLGIGLVPEAVARAWMSHKAATRTSSLCDQRTQPFAITAALISIETTQRLGQPIEALGAALIKVFAGSAG